MCLIADKIVTKNFRKEKMGKTITVYKRYRVQIKAYDYTTKYLASPFFTRSKDGTINQGKIIVSDRENKEIEWYEDDDYSLIYKIYQGIHVYLSKDIAQSCRMGNEVVVPVKAKISDLLGVDRNKHCAAFMKVELSQSAFDKAIKRESCLQPPEWQ